VDVCGHLLEEDAGVREAEGGGWWGARKELDGLAIVAFGLFKNFEDGFGSFSYFIALQVCGLLEDLLERFIFRKAIEFNINFAEIFGCRWNINLRNCFKI
jgi:hypothetical protein